MLLHRIIKNFRNPIGVNEVSVLQGDTYVVQPQTENPNLTFEFTDFSLNSLLKAGATDLLNSRRMLSGDSFSTQDMINALDSTELFTKDWTEPQQGAETEAHAPEPAPTPAPTNNSIN